jgi:membrane protein implicated in regulation of membrane protease activity
MNFNPVVWWTIAAVAFFIVEMATASFFFLWIGAGAVVTAVVSLFVDAAWIQYATFAVSSILLVAASRPWANFFAGKTKRLANVDGLVGRNGIVTGVSPDTAWQGTVKVDGEYWKVESENQETLVKNGQVTVKAARSNILVVKPL